MGLIKATIGAIGSTLKDQWEDYVKCDSMDNNTLVVKKTTKSGQISAKSRIQVSPGQVAIIFDSGKILDATAEEGIYNFDASTSPSLFAGQFGAVFKEAWQRFTYNGTPAKEQAIYYVNVKEIFDNKFGSTSPIPYNDPIYHDIYIRYHGSYTFKISNPLVFFQNVVGNVNDVFTKEQLMEQANAEFLSCIAGAIGNCAADGISYNALTREQTKIADYMNDALDNKWGELRGMEVVSVALDTPTPDDDSKKRIDKFAESRFYSTQENAAGRMVAATATAMENAASNENGAVNGFMGVGMMNMATGNMMGGQSPVSFTKPSESNSVAVSATSISEDKVIKCPKCGVESSGKFCPECGTNLEKLKNTSCPKCGTPIKDGAKFCTECGATLL